eukprot:TRINITY_DN194_c0_g1_i1.p1 TRINITY_DN194_c0_g1~~TRINITY_DN194_c0_g1_i1.p1  ORF type:complete len:321 (+),score=67.51 TRINITY_DN194_c0_g1_i1:95-964(+)
MNEYLSSILWVFGIGLSVFFSVAFYYQDYLLYYPNIPHNRKKKSFLPDKYGFVTDTNFFDITIPCIDGVKINIWLFTQPESTECPTLLFFHGNAGNISDRLNNIVLLFSKLQVNVAIMEYRGFGDSEGYPTQKGIQKDSRAALEYLLNEDKIDSDSIFLFGRSLGGAVALELASSDEYKDKIKGIIVENTFTSILDMIDHIMPPLKIFKFLVTNPWKNIDIVSKITSPTLFISSRNDNTVPYWMMDKLYDSLEVANDKKILKLENYDHMNAFFANDYFPTFNSFLDTNK